MTRLYLFFLASVAVGSLQAQFYAPDTEYHDIVQRTFPVEAARVLAWQRGAYTANVAEITYQVETTPAQETLWSIQWRDAAGHPLRERAVRYDAALLMRGGEFFREVFRQLCADDWKIAATNIGRLEQAYWDGARRAGVSRPEAISAARKFVADNPRLDAADDAARLAGLLGHGALPILASQLTLDSVLLSRASAWLCIAEALRGRPCDAGWAPLIFLAGRERLAGELWRALPARDPDAPSTGERFWEAMLRAHPVEAGFTFTARRDNRQHAFAAMAYHARVDAKWHEIMTYQAYRVVPTPHERDFDHLMREYEYASLLDRSPDYMRDPAFIYWMRAWMRLLGGFAEGGVDAARLQRIVPAPEKFEHDVVATVTAVAPLLEMALARSAGPLRPVAIASTADLLGFGWEFTAVQLGERAHRLSQSDCGKAEAFRKAVGSPSADMAPFFPAADRKAEVTTAQADRLQFIAAPRFQAPQRPEREVPEARLRRCWLWKDGGAPAIREMIGKGAADSVITEASERLMREGGQLALARLVGLPSDDPLTKRLAALGIEPRLIDALPSAYSARAWAIERSFRKDGDVFRKAQSLEQLDWQYAVGGNRWTIFESYLEANAPASARRYGSRVGLLDPLNQLENERFTLAWIEGDDATMRAMAAALARDPYGGPIAGALHALSRGDDSAAAASLDGATAKDKWWSRVAADLGKLLPLMPALRDPAHADRARALDGFPASEYSAFPQWVLLRAARLAGEDAVRFLGGEKAPPVNQMLIAAVRGDARRFEELYKEHAGEHASQLDPNARPLIHHLRCKLLAIAPPREEPDLMPAGVRSLEKRIREPLDPNTLEAKIARARIMAETFDLPDADADAKIEAAYQIGQDYALAPSDALAGTLRPIPSALLRIIEDHPS
ncbi:MAG: hypothetical protein ABMA01_18010, partial [Chthoniobacteraceae bacterium]